MDQNVQQLQGTTRHKESMPVFAGTLSCGLCVPTIPKICPKVTLQHPKTQYKTLGLLTTHIQHLPVQGILRTKIPIKCKTVTKIVKHVPKIVKHVSKIVKIVPKIVKKGAFQGVIFNITPYSLT